MTSPLRALTARNVVDCMVKVWQIFGVSQFITLDNAPCHTATLTLLVMERMGSSPIFITPINSRANGIAERYIGVIKELIHKVAIDKPKSWHKNLDMILWALREYHTVVQGCLAMYWHLVTYLKLYTQRPLDRGRTIAFGFRPDDLRISSTVTIKTRTK